MTVDRVKRALKASVRTLKEEGIFGFIKKAVSFFFSYGIYYVYERSTNSFEERKLSPESKGYKVKTIHSLQDLDKLEKEGYDFSMRNLKIGIKSSAVPFCIFSGKKMVHVTWVAINGKAKKEIDRVPVKIDFQKGEATSGGSFTDPLHRGKGLLACAYFHIFPYLAKHGFRKIRFVIHVDNIASQRGIKRVSPRLVSKGRYLKILWLNLWKELPSE